MIEKGFPPGRIHVYGGGARARAVAVALAREALPGATVREFADEAAATSAAEGGRAVLLDARVAPDASALARFAAQDGGALACARGFDGSLRRLPAGRIVDGGRAGGGGPPLAVGAWYDDPELGLAPQRGRRVMVHAQGLGHGGYASAARNTLVGLRRAGVDAVWQQIYAESELVAIDPADRALLIEGQASRGSARDGVDCSLAISPPTHLTGQLFLDRYLAAYARPPHVVYTMFETDAIPARWPRMLARVAKTWVPSRFNLETFAAAGVPRELIEYVPLGLEVEQLPLDGPALAIAGRRRFAFLSVFGFSLRKGWDLLVAAWARAFERDDDVCLILRTGGAGSEVRASIEARLRGGGFDPARTAPIIVLEQPLSASDLAALYRSADAFVLPSRGEGVGLPYLEAMAFGLPAIGTDWSGSTEFLTARTGYPIASEPRLVERETWRDYPVLRAQHWAAPSILALVSAMRAVYDDPREAASRAARACALARIEYNRTRTGRIAAEALERVEARPRARRRAEASVRVQAPLFSTGGAGASARGLLGALEAAGIGVAAEVDGPDQRALLFRDDARLLRAALERRPAETLPRIVRASDGTQWMLGAQALPLPEAIDVERWTPQLGALSGLGSERAARFLATTRLTEESGYERVIGAFLRAFEPGEEALLALKVPDAEVDPAHAQALVARAAARHAPHRSGALAGYRISILAGLVPEGDYMQLLGSFDAFLSLAAGRGRSRALLEAMATSLACICTGPGALYDERTAFVVLDGALDALAAAMREIAADPDAAAARGAAARRLVVERHSYAAVGRLARAVLDGRAPEAPAAVTAREEIGIILDASAGGDLEAARAALEANTVAPHRIAIAGTSALAFQAACAQVTECAFVAYVAAPARVTEGWDVMLRDAVRSRPLVALAVPRIAGGPEPQGVPARERLASYARELSITQMGRGMLIERVATACLLFDGPRFAAAARRHAAIEGVVRACGAHGGAWCCHDVAVGWDGASAPLTLALGSSG